MTKFYCKLIFVFSLLLSLNFILASDELIFSIDLIRHGDRNPCSDLPKFPYEWKEGLENLTAEGTLQLLKLGQQLKKEYQEDYHLLPSSFNKELVYVRSTDFNRTKESAKALLNGLYPEAPIPIETVKINDDDLLITKPSWNPFSLFTLYWYKRNISKEVEQTYSASFPYLESLTGLAIKNMEDLDTLIDNLSIRMIKNIPLPKGLDKNQAINLTHAIDKYTLQLFQRDELTSPMGRTFLDNVGSLFKNSKTGKSKLKYALFAGHDSTIMAVMNELRMPLQERPPYASRLNFSLLKNGSEYHVRVNYNGKDIIMGKCGGPICPLDQFLTI